MEEFDVGSSVRCVDASEVNKQMSTADFEAFFSDATGFAPLGQVISGMDVVDSLYSGYGEGAPRGQGPDQGRIGREGNAYLRASFPRLDSVATARVTRQWTAARALP